MSADNWAVCPKCLADSLAKENQLKLDAGKAYGKVSPEEMWDKVAAPVAVETSLREDYEVGIDGNGLFEVIYSGSCSTCAFNFRYKHSEQTK